MQYRLVMFVDALVRSVLSVLVLAELLGSMHGCQSDPSHVVPSSYCLKMIKWLCLWYTSVPLESVGVCCVFFWMQFWGSMAVLHYVDLFLRIYDRMTYKYTITAFAPNLLTIVSLLLAPRIK